jgi:hypothetical protein
MTPSPSEIAADARWFAHDFDPLRRVVELRFAERSHWADKAFLDRRTADDALPRCEVALDDISPLLAPAPLNIIWHSAFCCSTLLAVLISIPGRNISLREPQILTALAAARRRGLAQADDAAAIFALLARRFEGDALVTLKPNNIANNLIDWAPRGTHTLYLHSDRETFVLAILSRAERGEAYVRNLLTALGENAVASVPAMASRAWELQIAAFRAGLAHGGVSLDCETLLDVPEPTLRALDAFFALGLGPDIVRATASGPALHRHAKTGGRFDTAARLAERDARRIRFSAALDGLPPAAPLSSPLIEKAFA